MGYEPDQAALPSLFSQRAQLAWGLRSGAHVALGLLDQRDATAASRRQWAGVTALSVVGDLVFRRSLEADSMPHGTRRTVSNAAEAALWAFAGRAAPSTSRHAQIAHVVVPAIESGFRLGAGDVAVPGLEPSRPWPPGRNTLGRSLVETLGPPLVPHFAMRVVRRSKGYPWRRFEYAWGLLALAGGFGLARYRSALQAEARRNWRDRAEQVIAREREAAAVTAAIRSSVGHDFKKTLSFLGDAGSEPARAASRVQQARPTQIAAAAGTTLMGAAWPIPVEPEESRGVWISDDQVAVLDRFLEEVDAALPPIPTNAPAVVTSVSGLRIAIRYRDRVLVLSNPPPRLEASLDPVPMVLVIGAAWKLLTLLHPDVRAPFAPTLLSSGLDFVAAASYRHSSGETERRVASATILAVGSALLFDAAVIAARPAATDSTGEHVLLATGPACGVIGLLGACRQSMPPRLVLAALVSTVVGWVAASKARIDRPWRVLGVDAVPMWQTFAAVDGMLANLTNEVSALEDDLQVEFALLTGVGRRDAARHEVERYLGQAVLARRELGAVRSRLDAADAAWVEDQCTILEGWALDPATVDRLLS